MTVQKDLKERLIDDIEKLLRIPSCPRAPN